MNSTKPWLAAPWTRWLVGLGGSAVAAGMLLVPHALGRTQPSAGEIRVAKLRQAQAAESATIDLLLGKEQSDYLEGQRLLEAQRKAISHVAQIKTLPRVPEIQRQINRDLAVISNLESKFNALRVTLARDLKVVSPLIQTKLFELPRMAHRRPVIQQFVRYATARQLAQMEGIKTLLASPQLLRPAATPARPTF